MLKIWPEYEKFTNDAVSPTALLLKLRQSLAFIDMLTTAVTGEKALASAAIPFLETWDSPADALKQLPRHLRSVNDVRRCDELLRLWGTTQTSPSIVRMSFGRDAEFSRKLVWSVCLVGQGRVVVSLRDMRPQTHQHLIMGEYDAANAQTQSLLNDYISAMKQFVETLSILKEG